MHPLFYFPITAAKSLAIKYPRIIPAKFRIRSSVSKLRPMTDCISSTAIGTKTAIFRTLRLFIFSDTSGRKKPRGANIRRL